MNLKIRKIITTLIVISLVSAILFLYYENQKLKNRLNTCCELEIMGTWIDSQTGGGYSGIRKHCDDIPLSQAIGKPCY